MHPARRALYSVPLYPVLLGSERVTLHGPALCTHILYSVRLYPVRYGRAGMTARTLHLTGRTTHPALRYAGSTRATTRFVTSSITSRETRPSFDAERALQSRLFN